MPKLSGINHQRAVRAFEKAGFWISREGKHVTMTNGKRIITIPRANPVTKKFISKTTFSQPLCHSGLSRILLLSERFPTSGNDNHETLLMNSLVMLLRWQVL